ncbi:hypothetical protein EV06_0278 [Prochlorococcus sp. MIT 0602]|uniref:hypothetical protein n=1 Tax=Prochlorococcus sp. MIT 0601 TaxID=1499498 RepID=UPI000533777E|nr:hypothetical protein EV06_0278 [Prochlorococcus sp. MIT 0602]
MRNVNTELEPQRNYSKRALLLLKSSFSNSSILRKHPLLANFHKGVDGALVGVILSGSVMTSLALHSQHLWTLNFSRLDLTRDLIHKVEESTSILERHFLKIESSPTHLVSTKSAHLLYIDKPQEKKRLLSNLVKSISDHLSPFSYPSVNGY